MKNLKNYLSRKLLHIGALLRTDNRGEINIISMVLIIIVVIALVAIFQDEMTDIVTKMFDKIRESMGV